jgi:hypothetical protein
VKNSEAIETWPKKAPYHLLDERRHAAGAGDVIPTFIRRVSLGGPRPNYPEGFHFDQKLSVAIKASSKSIFVHYLSWDLQWR